MRILAIIFICLVLSGCATPSYNPAGLIHNVNLGMTKQAVFNACGNPSEWTRQSINGKIYETWHYAFYTETYDFVDNILVGYSNRGRYITKDKIEDVRNYPSK